ncbi:alpha/beta fold hydrolase [Gordonia sp. ABSL1-1]|uniref:alpha/beta hydrolase family protein n=1 Tax=Gordonia sp. ABSL1-1 TaxID=3053923 RepID=UPI002572839C|nr:alpha/beta fold hydrolase [Gordonia sp. ABSL1-1]MDL9936601.1 alpha/beta fold hydrolase [Gordonia sp. ABSL1-1]
MTATAGKRGALAGVVAVLAVTTACGTSPRPEATPPSAVATPISGSASSQTITPVAVPAPIPSGPRRFTTTRVAYPTRGVADPVQNFADLYLPVGDHAVATVPLVLLIHGGSWRSDIDLNDLRHLATDLARRGVAVYNIEFRRIGTGGGWPTTFTDVADALDAVSSLRSTHPQLDIDRATLVGHSSGAQLAAWAGTRNRLAPNDIGGRPRFRPARIVAISGPLDLVHAVRDGNDRIVNILGGTPDEVADRYRQVDPAATIDPLMPVIVVHGDRDRLVPIAWSRSYVTVARRAGAPVEMLVIPGGAHGMPAHPRAIGYREIVELLVDPSGDTLGRLQQRFAPGNPPG